MSRDSFLIAQLSDIHCGSPFFDPQLLRHAVEEVRALAPDLVLIGGDLTTDGYAHEFRDANARRVQQFKDRAIAFAEIRFRVGRLDKANCIFQREMHR